MPVPPTGAVAGEDDGLRLARRTAGNALASAVSQVFGKAASLVWLLVAARVLEPAAFGAFSYALALMLLVSSVVEWGFSAVLVQRASAHPETADRVYTATQVWQLALAVPLYAATVAAVWGSRPEPDVRLALVATAVATAAETWCSTSRGLAAAKQRQGRMAVALTVQRTGTAVLVVVGLLLVPSLTGLTVAFAVGTLLGVPVHARVLRRLGGRLSAAGLRPRELTAVFRASHVLGLAGIALVALARLDQVLLGLLVDDAAVASYAVAYRLLETVFFVSFAVRSAVFPVLAADPRPEVAARVLERATTALAVVYVPYAVVCLLAARPVLHLLFGEPYGETAAGALAWLSLTPLLFATGFLGVGALQALRRERGILVGAVVALLMNLVLNLVLIPPFGETGAAVATVLSYGAQAAITLVALARCGARPHLLRACSLALAAGLPLAGALLLPVPFAVALPLGAVLYAASWWVLGVRLAPDQVAAGLRLLPGRLRGRLARAS